MYLRNGSRFLATCLILVLLLVACGGAPTAEQPVSNSPAAAAPPASPPVDGDAAASEATAEPSAAEDATPAAPDATDVAPSVPTTDAADAATAEPTANPEDTARTGVLVNLTTDDTWSANMALSLATNALDQGVEPVIVFLNVRGVYLADQKRLPATEGNSEQNIHEKLQAFMAAGGQVVACPGCSREAGLTQEDYIEGVVLGEPGGIIPTLTDPRINVISYIRPATGQ